VNAIRIMLFILLPLITVSCKTTGDPNQGGLFGWNEEKAKQRKDVLEGKQREKQNQLSKVTQQNKSLEGKKQKYNSSLDLLNKALQQLLKEQDNLREQVNQLYNNSKLSQEKLNELNNKYPWLNIDESETEDQFIYFEQEDLARNFLKKSEKDNKSLVEEILLLIGN